MVVEIRDVSRYDCHDSTHTHTHTQTYDHFHVLTQLAWKKVDASISKGRGTSRRTWELLYMHKVDDNVLVVHEDAGIEHGVCREVSEHLHLRSITNGLIPSSPRTTVPNNMNKQPR